MTPFEREEMKRRARAKLAAMRERAVRVRKRVLSGAAIAFVVIWAAIFAQMITGNDPALGPVTANMRATAQESFASDPERRAQRATAPPSDDEEGQLEATRLEEEQIEATAEAERAELEAIEAEELAAVTTGQS